MLRVQRRTFNVPRYTFNVERSMRNVQRFPPSPATAFSAFQNGQ